MTPEARGFTAFHTSLGECGIAWDTRGIRAVGLPEATRAALFTRLAQRLPGASEATPPEHVDAAIAGVCALLAGESRDLCELTLDMQGVPAFHARVYEAARRITPGHTSTYGALARELGEPGAARAVGQALGRNPFAIVVPCHRVLAAHNRDGGFSASGGLTTKLRMLAIERAGTLPLFELTPYVNGRG